MKACLRYCRVARHHSCVLIDQKDVQELRYQPLVMATGREVRGLDCEEGTVQDQIISLRSDFALVLFAIQNCLVLFLLKFRLAERKVQHESAS